MTWTNQQIICLSAPGQGANQFLVVTTGQQASPPYLFNYTTTPFIPGDTNGDGIISQAELNAVLAGYWPNSPWITMSNFVKLDNGLFQFALTNATGWNFTVQYSTDLGTTWQPLGMAYPVYQFADPATNASQRFYRLRWPTQ